MSFENGLFSQKATDMSLQIEAYQSGVSLSLSEANKIKFVCELHVGVIKYLMHTGRPRPIRCNLCIT